MAFTVPAIFKAIDKVTAPVRKMEASVKRFGMGAAKSMQRASLAMNRFNHRVNSVFVKLKKGLGTLGIVAGFALLVTVLNSAGSAVLDYESALVGVGKTTGIENDNLKLLGASIVKTSNILKTVKTDTLLELAEAAGQLGVKGTDNILNFAKTMAKLEKASDIAGEEGAKSIARLLTITKEGPGVVDKFAASLVALGNSSAASESEILSVASEVGRATAAYSLHSKEILGISAALKSLDVAPEAAGSSVGKVFRKIELATLKGGKDLEKFSKIMGLTPKQVKDTFKKSPQEAFSFFIKGLGRIKDEGGSVAKSLIDVGLSGERVSKGIIPLATNYKLLEDKIKLSQKAFKENIALDKEFEASQRTIKSAINSIVRAYENLFITQATAGSEMEKVQKVLFAIGDNLGTIFKVIGVLVGAFLAFKITMLATNIAIGAYNILLGISQARSASLAVGVGGSTAAMNAQKIATYGLIAAQWLYNTAIKAVKFAQLLYTGSLVPAIAATWAFTTALLANPMTWVVIGVMALIAAIVLLIVKWKDVSKWIKKVWNQFKNTKFIQVIIEKFKTFVEFIQKTIDKIKEVTGKVKNFFGRGNTMKTEESLIVQAERQGGLQDVLGASATADLAGNVTNNREVVTRENNNPIVTQNNSRVDLFLNNRAQGTEAFAEGTGVEVHNTGY